MGLTVSTPGTAVVALDPEPPEPLPEPLPLPEPEPGAGAGVVTTAGGWVAGSWVATTAGVTGPVVAIGVATVVAGVGEPWLFSGAITNENGTPLVRLLAPSKAR